jgi:hypothetical protein
MDRQGRSRIPDLTPMDFFWGYIQDIVQSESLEPLSDLRRRITVANIAVPVDALPRVWGEVEFRFDVCTAVTCPHTEQH